MTLADIFSTVYGFDTGAGGLAYLGLGVGFLVASLFGAKFGSGMYKKVSVAVTVIPNPFLSWKARDAHSGPMCWVSVCSYWFTVRTLP